MAHRLRSVALDFVESAPLRLVFAVEVSADAGAVYEALVDDVETWPAWWSAVTRIRPYPDGSGREVWLRGGARSRETIMAREPAERYAYRVDVTNVPGTHALLEEWRLRSTGTGTRVQWTLAAAGTAPFLFTARLGRAALGRSFRDGVRKLDRRLGG
ncbi:SRPBCC family protein [Streptomyces sannanensis]|uniref:SRPBCC family protein n=1 Tax=Streptomyces sannanensis TaxID=285536 RepID=A0ABP6SKA5_9ACTN